MRWMSTGCTLSRARGRTIGPGSAKLRVKGSQLRADSPFPCYGLGVIAAGGSGTSMNTDVWPIRGEPGGTGSFNRWCVSVPRYFRPGVSPDQEPPNVYVVPATTDDGSLTDILPADASGTNQWN